MFVRRIHKYPYKSSKFTSMERLESCRRVSHVTACENRVLWVDLSAETTTSNVSSVMVRRSP